MDKTTIKKVCTSNPWISKIYFFVMRSRCVNKEQVIHRIYNGVNTDIFLPKENGYQIKKKLGIEGRMMVLGVAGVWSSRKGLTDFLHLRALLDKKFAIVLVGLSKGQIKMLPTDVIGISHTESMEQLADLYSTADVFINPSYEETFGLTTAEALACGTPSVVYDSTACSEVISSETGITVEAGNYLNLCQAVKTVCKNGKAQYLAACRQRALNCFRKEDRYAEYMELYNQLVNKRK